MSESYRRNHERIFGPRKKALVPYPWTDRWASAYTFADTSTGEITTTYYDENDKIIYVDSKKWGTE